MTRIFLSAPDISGHELERVSEAFDSNFVAPAGPMLERFEADMCRYTGFAHAVALSSGTAALHLALRELGVGPGDQVWTTSMTFIGGVSPIVFLGATPVFFDLTQSTWTIDISLIDEELKKAAAANKLPKAIVPTDLYGQPCDLGHLVSIAQRYDVPVIADSAEAIGAFYDGKHAGKGAAAAVYSFNGNKIITTSGGGMLLSDDKKLIDRARYLATQARQPAAHYEHTEIGYNYRMSNICAAIGIGQLEQIERKVTRRREIFETYRAAFADVDGIALMPEAPNTRATRWLTCLTIDPNSAGVDRHTIFKALEEANIESRPLWKPMHMQPVFSAAQFVGSGICEQLFANGLCLPSGSGMSDSDQQRVIATMRQHLAG